MKFEHLNNNFEKESVTVGDLIITGDNLYLLIINDTDTYIVINLNNNENDGDWYCLNTMIDDISDVHNGIKQIVKADKIKLVIED